MNDIQRELASPSNRREKRSELETGFEDGFSLSRRSVLTEPLLPARCSPVKRRRRARSSPPCASP